MSSETSFFGEETGSESPWRLTEYHLVNPEEAYSNIVDSIRRGEGIILAAKVYAGIGRISVEDVEDTIDQVEASFTELTRVAEADGLFEPNSSSRLEARGTTNYPSLRDSGQRPLTVVFQQSDDNRVSSGHFFLTQ